MQYFTFGNDKEIVFCPTRLKQGCKSVRIIDIKQHIRKQFNSNIVIVNLGNRCKISLHFKGSILDSFSGSLHCFRMRSKALIQAYDIQDLAYQAIMQFKADRMNSKGELVLGKFDAMKLTQLVKSWEIAQERVRINRNKPLPGSLRPESNLKRVRVKPANNIIDVVYPAHNPQAMVLHESPQEPGSPAPAPEPKP